VFISWKILAAVLGWEGWMDGPYEAPGRAARAQSAALPCVDARTGSGPNEFGSEGLQGEDF
jgi:hypothetical protein